MNCAGFGLRLNFFSIERNFSSFEKTFECEMELIEPQKHIFFTKNNGLWSGLIFLLLSTIAMIVFCIRINCIACMFFITVFLQPASWCAASVQKAYPVVEFDFIPDWKNVIKKRRSRIKWWLGAILLPLVLAAIWDGIKWLWLLQW